jgi:hypothetical protein
MRKEKYIKPEIKREVHEAEVLQATHGSPTAGDPNGGGNISGLRWKKNWH